MFQAAFLTDHSFSDHENYPDGFFGSGVFTAEQALLLKKHGHAYSAFASGERVPLLPLENEFVEFCKGVKLPSNIHEQTWFCYVSKAC
ncbi:DUF413 domain-containing protein [uncultured Neptuniibacter sp.]|uniref:DUF413 domain-containing protein n=1 Tax=uncultured Neptuniibacter sp. TaxID=502143 RepID=UPI0026067F64|nr:DUF413 domain-containing protein [uncultured Neptuniibacter sp.]